MVDVLCQLFSFKTCRTLMCLVNGKGLSDIDVAVAFETDNEEIEGASLSLAIFFWKISRSPQFANIQYANHQVTKTFQLNDVHFPSNVM